MSEIELCCSTTESHIQVDYGQGSIAADLNPSWRAGKLAMLDIRFQGLWRYTYDWWTAGSQRDILLFGTLSIPFLCRNNQLFGWFNLVGNSWHILYICKTIPGTLSIVGLVDSCRYHVHDGVAEKLSKGVCISGEDAVECLERLSANYRARGVKFAGSYCDVIIQINL